MSFFSLKPTRVWTINCRDCKQRISKMVNTGLIINDENGPGGNRGDDHICPNRLRTGSAANLQRIKETIICKRCSRKFPGRHVDCPFCFKLICQACGAIQDWLFDTPKNTCNRCGHPYLAWTEISVYVSDGIYRRKTPEEIGWEPIIAPNVKQIPGCANWGHILRPGDKNCRVCGVGVIR
jgi:hypothetical protein